MLIIYYNNSDNIMTSAPNYVHACKCLQCTSHGTNMMSVSHSRSLVSRLVGA